MSANRHARLMPESVEDSLSAEELQAGMEWFRSRPSWEKDFHSARCAKLASRLTGGVDRGAWSILVDELAAWQALRPRPKAEFLSAGAELLARLDRARTEVLARARPGEPLDLAQLDWADVCELYAMASSLKVNRDGPSQVFGSKLCHFLVPAAFPVADGVATGLRRGGYEAHWRDRARAWRECGSKDALRAIIAAAIRAGGVEPRADYPYGAKIAELCAIGARARSKNAPAGA